jgi:hypothetical protein
VVLKDPFFSLHHNRLTELWVFGSPLFQYTKYKGKQFSVGLHYNRLTDLWVFGSPLFQYTKYKGKQFSVGLHHNRLTDLWVFGSPIFDRHTKLKELYNSGIMFIARQITRDKEQNKTKNIANLPIFQ